MKEVHHLLECLVMPSPDKLPYTIRVLLESAVRNCDEFQITKEDVEKIMGWEKTSLEQVEIPFKPSRVILQVRLYKDLTLVDFPYKTLCMQDFLMIPWLRILLVCLSLLTLQACATQCRN